MITATEWDPAAYPHSTRTETAWRFASGAAEQSERLALVQLEYRADTGGGPCDSPR